MEEKKKEAGIGEVIKKAKESINAMGKESKDVEEITGSDFSTIKASVTKNEYKIVPCSLGTIPKFVKQVKRFETSCTQNQGDDLAMVSEDSEMLDAMAEIILMSMHPEHNFTKEKALEEFGMSDFPKVFQEALNLNDFLAQMRAIKTL